MNRYRTAPRAATPKLAIPRAVVLSFPARRPPAIVDPIDALRLLRRARLGADLSRGTFDAGLLDDLAGAGLLNPITGELTRRGAAEADRLRDHVLGYGEDRDDG